MIRHKSFYLFMIILIVSTQACSIIGQNQQVTSAEKTANAVRTQISGFVNAGSGLIKTAEAIATQHPGVLQTVKAIATQGAPVLSTIQAVATYNPGLVQTAQSVILKEVPTGEPPADIPVIDRDKTQNYFGSSQYIFYISPDQYSQVLDFYKTEMPNNGWQFLQSESHEYAQAAQLSYSKDTRTATVNMSVNPLNNTSVVVINIITH